jgi:hypothetical protein
VPVSEFAADEVAFGLRMTWTAAAGRIAYACDLAGRLPVTFAALGAGLIDPVHAKIIAEQTEILFRCRRGQGRPGAGRRRGSAERCKQARRKEAHVRPFREDSGNAGMTAREMPTDEVLASWQHVDQRARDLRAAGVPGTLRELRVRAYLDLLQERDSRDALRDPEPGRGQGDQSSRNPHTRWCVTALHPDGTAAAHGCAPGQHPAPPGPTPPGPEPAGPEPPGPAPPASGPPDTAPHAPPGTANLGTTCDTRGSPDQRPPPGTRARDYLRSLRVQLTPIARGPCNHRHAETGYQPSRKLQHLIHARSTRCSAPGCGRPAARCDLDHTVAWHLGGPSCECNLAPPCKR